MQLAPLQTRYLYRPLYFFVSAFRPLFVLGIFPFSTPRTQGVATRRRLYLLAFSLFKACLYLGHYGGEMAFLLVSGTCSGVMVFYSCLCLGHLQWSNGTPVCV